MCVCVCGEGEELSGAPPLQLRLLICNMQLEAKSRDGEKKARRREGLFASVGRLVVSGWPGGRHLVEEGDP